MIDFISMKFSIRGITVFSLTNLSLFRRIDFLGTKLIVNILTKPQYWFDIAIFGKDIPIEILSLGFLFPYERGI